MDYEGPKAGIDDFKRALKAVRDDDKVSVEKLKLWRKLLGCHYAMPGHTITAMELAQQCKLASFSEANLRYGALAHAVADHLRFQPEPRPTGDRKPMWWLALSTGSYGDDRDSMFQFTMRPELIAALEEMGWVRQEARPD
ncbi:MAG TPA: hypothetical protein VG826_20350 [Pirellulales bacterium]|nr:hypothetical protein [Pirellulales bacterium]